MPEFNFSHRFSGVVWNTVAYPKEDLVLLEIRDTSHKQVTFSALNYKTNQFLWHGRKLDEPWWVNVSGIVNGVVLFTVYLDTANPDKKAVLAYTLEDLKLLWWHNDFSISMICENSIVGYTSKLGLKEVVLQVQSGKEYAAHERTETREVQISGEVLKPVQYLEGMPYFETVKIFLAERLNFLVLNSLEYLETSSYIAISCYVKHNELANYLIVLTLNGDLALKEILDPAVKGIGLDTFFAIGRSLFFVRNKMEFVSYTMI
ncbi:MAG TPA: DUF4905 domain-containing protein [Ohtaekwangia sp.]|nr:DUF4905 domain-containing protein [Ohtaekwangia sp.]